MDTPTYPYMSELKDLIKEPKTLRSMKHTNWSDTHNYSLDSSVWKCYIRVKATDYADFVKTQKELNNALVKKLELSEKLLSKFALSEYNDIIYFNRVLCKDLKNVFNRIIDLMNENKQSESVLKSASKYSCDTIENINKTIKDNENKISQLKTDYGIMEKQIASECKLVPTGFDALFANECRISCEDYYTGEFRVERLIGKQQFIDQIKEHTKTPSLRKGEDYEYSIKYSYVVNGDTYYSNEYYNNNENYDISTNRLKIFKNTFLKKGVDIKYHKDTNNTLFMERMFNITKKKMKAWNMENVKEEDKYISQKKLQGNFIPYEENGVECLYVKLGYKSDGAKNNNYNRGTLQSLKYAYSENMCSSVWCDKKNKYVKRKDIKIKPTKKDDFIKILMKL